MKDRIAFLEQEVAGYQRLLKEASEEPEHKTVVMLVMGKSETRIYGPTPDREREMAETVARWLKTVGVVSDCLRIKAAREALDRIEAVLTEPSEGGAS